MHYGWVKDSEDAPSAGSIPPGFNEPTFGQRLVARLIDALVVLPVIVLIAAVADGLVRGALALASVATYEIALVACRGQTLGKMAMGTRVVDRTSGTLPSLEQAAGRWIVVIAGSVVALAVPQVEPFEIIYTLVVLAPVLRPPLHRGLHDLAAGTVVSSRTSVAVPG